MMASPARLHAVHADLIDAIEKHAHEKLSDAHWRFRHGSDMYDAGKLDTALRQAGYYSAGRDHSVPDTEAWAAYNFVPLDSRRRVHLVRVYRKTDNGEHFTDIVLHP
jgi:hypothetical protein